MSSYTTRLTRIRQVSSAALQAHTVRAHHTLMLDKPWFVCLVCSGAAEVYSTPIESGRPVGRRRFLFRARPQDAVFAVVDEGGEAQSCLIMIALEELTVLEVPLLQIRDAFGSEGVDVAAAVEGWVNNAANFISQGPLPPAAEQITEYGDLTMDPEQRLYPGRNKFAWVRVDEGRALFMGIPELQVDGGSYLPLGNNMWLQSAGHLKIKTAPTEEVLAGGSFLPGLDLLHRLLAKRLSLLELEDRQRDAARLEERRRMQHRLSESDKQTVASVLDHQKIVPVRETALLSAVALVGDALGVEIRPPLRSENADRLKDPLDAIIRASRVRHRPVLLRDGWWKNDGGPLLAYLDQNRSPVALLNTRGIGYEIVDPATQSRRPVDDRTAQLLSPQAVMLYPSLPADAKTPWQLVKFSLRGRLTDILFIFALSLATTLIGMLTPFAMAMVMDNAIPDSNRGLLLELGLGLVAASLGVGLFNFARGLVTLRAAIAVDAVTEASVWDKLLKLQVWFYKRFSIGDLLSRVMSVSEINRALNGAVLQSALSSVMALLNLGLLFYYSSQLAMIALGLALVALLVTTVGGYFVRRYNLVLLELGGSIFGHVVQMVNAVGKIRVAGAEQRAFSIWLGKYSEQLKLVQKSQSVEDYVTVFNQAVPTLSTILLFWVGVDLLMGGPAAPSASSIGVGSFLAFNTAMATFIGGVTALSNTVVDMTDTIAKSKRIEPILQAEAEISEAKADPGVLLGSITLSHVDFRYAAEGPKILDDLTLHVNPGEFVALAGPSGSGKSTIFRLLLGFETPEAGAVLFDGQDLKGIDVTALRRQFGVVLQSGFVAGGSILENIAGGALISLEEAWEAAADAALADDLKDMPMGMHTVISEGGTNLSGGQRQRLLLARALVTRPRILLMDEATSALDNRTQAIVSESLRRRKVTRLVIAHRLSTIKDADQIYVMDQGRIIDRGSFQELANRKGLFADMIARQLT